MKESILFNEKIDFTMKTAESLMKHRFLPERNRSSPETSRFFEEKRFKHRQLDKITMIDKTDEYDMHGSLQHTLAGYYFY